MNKANELFDQAISLPLEERAVLADLILKSLNMPNYSNDIKWLSNSKRRLNELRPGKVQPIPGHIVFQRIKERFKV